MNKIKIVGLGPGNVKYIPPIALEAINSSDIVIGGRRNLDTINLDNKEILEIKGNLENILNFIKLNKENKKICIVVSGDPGIFSFFQFLKNHFNEDEFNIIPGISSIHYMFTKIGRDWNNAYFGSLHGRDIDFVEKVKQFRTVVLLTDKKRSYKYIAKELYEVGLGDKIMYIGNNLSYENEVIIKDKAKNYLNYTQSFNLCVVVIIND